MKYVFLVAVILLGTLAAHADDPTSKKNLRDQYSAPFEGPMLRDAFKKGTVFICVSNLAGSTGVYPASGEYQIISEFSKQTNPAIWYLLIEKEVAFLMDNQGNQQDMVTTKFNSEGITLVGAGRNESVQVITMDPNNSSFVYTSQNSGMLWNRASTFVGKCTTEKTTMRSKFKLTPKKP